MSQSLSHVIIHLVFSTKNRTKVLNPELRPALHAYMASVMRSINCPILIVNSVEDHVHMLFALSRTVTIAKAVATVKAASSRWIKAEDARLSRFAWQGGYSSFSVSESRVRIVRKYIENQQAHHQKMSFQAELRKLLRKHGVSWDEAHVWD